MGNTDINARRFLSAEELKRVKEAIAAAEALTSGEIRVHIENTFKGEVIDRAVYVFEKLDMHKTALRNGVLIYVAVKNRSFAIIGDTGINERVGQHFWDEVKEKMQQQFADGHYAAGLCDAVRMAGTKLSAFFPISENDSNELSDDISFND